MIIFQGETRVTDENFESLLKVAQCLQIKGFNHLQEEKSASLNAQKERISSIRDNSAFIKDEQFYEDSSPHTENLQDKPLNMTLPAKRQTVDDYYKKCEKKGNSGLSDRLNSCNTEDCQYSFNSSRTKWPDFWTHFQHSPSPLAPVTSEKFFNYKNEQNLPGHYELNALKAPYHHVSEPNYFFAQHYFYPPHLQSSASVFKGNRSFGTDTLKAPTGRRKSHKKNHNHLLKLLNFPAEISSSAHSLTENEAVSIEILILKDFYSQNFMFHELKTKLRKF